MNYYGIRKLLPWFEDFLTGRTERVIVEGTKSRLINILSGIPQGTVIAGLLFLIFINDLPESVTESFTGLFCDDTLVAKDINSDRDVVALQSDLDKIYEWTQVWGMKFNSVKCVVMTVSNKKNTIMNSYHLNSMFPAQCLIKESSIKYLGVTIDNNLSFNKHVEEKCKSATKILNLLRRNLYFAPKSVKTKAYQSCVRPIIEYAATCWSPTSQKYSHKLEMIQHRAAKFVTNLYPRKGHYEEYSISAILNNLGWYSLAERRNMLKLTMAYKILNNHVIIPPEALPKVNHSRPIRKCNEPSVGKQHVLAEPLSRLKNTGKTFFYHVPKLWNDNVSPVQANAPSVDSFKLHFS